MKRLCASLGALGLVVLAGCPSRSTGPGGPTGKESFVLKAPKGPVEVLRGGEKAVKITVERKAGFKEEIKLSAEVAPADKGVKASIKPETLKPVDESAELTIEAEERAAAAEYKVKVTGTAGSSTGSTTVTVKVPGG
jgi:hypothetical protein